MPVREAAARGQWRDDFAGLRGLGNHDAGEWRAHHGVVDVLLGDVQLALRNLRIALGGIEPRTQGIAIRNRLVVLLCRDELLVDQTLHPHGVRLGLAELCAHVADLAACGRDLRGGERALCVGVDRIKAGHHVAGSDLLAFFDHHLEHLAGHLG